MEFHQLRDFVAVASTGNFSQAASQCHVAQPSLSKAVQKLESEMGEKLFVRSKRGTLLTSAGDILYRHAVRILKEEEEAKKEIAESNGTLTGKMHVGVLSTISPNFLPKAFAQFNQKFPSFHVIVVEDKASHLHRRVISGELDIALVTLPLPGNGVQKEILFEEELLLAAPPGHPLAVKENIELKDLENEQFILMEEEHCLAAQVTSFFQKNGVHAQCTMHMSHIETVQAMIMVGLGISMVPRMAVSARIPLVYRSLGNPKPTRTVTAIWKTGRNLSKVSLEILNDVRQTAKAFSETLNK